MSEEPEVKTEEVAEAAPAKKAGGGKSKLIVMVLLAVVLAGGGFFGFKIMGAKKSTVPKALKVGKTVTLQEFLVNLNDQKTFLKTQISLGIAEGMELGHAGGGGHAKGEDDPVVRDTIIMILTSKKLADINSPAGKEKLKKEITKALNEKFGEHEKPKEKSEAADKSTDNPDKKKSGEHKTEEPNKGPVLEVYFTSFATQKL